MKVTIDRFKYEAEEFVRKHCEFMDKIASINIAENKEVEELIEGDGNHLNKWSTFEQKYPEKVKEREEQRKKLKEQYGHYANFIACPYYCIVKSVRELKQLVKKGESNYKYYVKALTTLNGKMVSNDSVREPDHGVHIGLAFFVDDVYHIVKSEKTGKNELWLSVKKYEKPKEDKRPYRMVSNGKDYL